MNKLKFFVFVSLMFCTGFSFAMESVVSDSLPVKGKAYVDNSMFKEYLYTRDLTYFLDNLNDYAVYQSETSGGFDAPDRLLFSVAGNSYQWNKYYIDGFRTDSRFLVGSTFYRPDMRNHSFEMDYINSSLYFYSDENMGNSARLSYNVGNLGGISAGTKQFINLFHKTASERVYKPVEIRNHIVGAGSLGLNYAIPVDGKSYMQSFYADFGRRNIVAFDETGINKDWSYPEDYFNINLNGQLPVRPFLLFDKLNYLFHASQRDNMNSEFYFGKDETARHNAYSVSLYGVKESRFTKYTSGITFAANSVRHDNIGFMRNIIDQDGEGFEPWYPDGCNYEFSYALNLKHKINRAISLTFDGYNSLINFSPTTNRFSNAVYMKMPYEKFNSLYVYDWESQAFWSGLFENTLGVNVERSWTSWLDFSANLDVTVDAMVLADKSMFRPGWQARVGFNVHPCSWFNMELNLSRERVAFNYDNIRFLSRKYMNADIYYWKDANGDEKYQPEEKSSYFTSTGGEYHNTVEMLKQPSYFTIDLPIIFKFGRHKIYFLNTYRKYFNTWFTYFDGEATDYGHFEDYKGDADVSHPDKIFFLNGGKPVNYTVGTYPEEYRDMMDKGGWGSRMTNTPYYMSSVIGYQYIGPKFYFTASWQSFLMAGAAGLGNGVLQNNIGVLSETTANPNNMYKGIGRYDQDKAFIARMHLGYNITKNFSVGLTGKFKDGQPFSSFETMLLADEAGNSQLAIWNGRTKGINPYTNDFGSREDAFFNFDLSARYRGNIKKHPFEVEVMCYNIYDFGTELSEYTFNPRYKYNSSELNQDGRHAMSLSIPRGLWLSFCLGL